MTPEEITKLRDQCNAATAGPWEANGTGAYVAMMSIVNDKIVKYVSAPQAGMCLSETDIAFIAAAREAVPKLLDALEAAEARESKTLGSLRDALIKQGDMYTVDFVRDLLKERDTARAQVETLAEALRQQDCPPKYLNKPTEEELA